MDVNYYHYNIDDKQKDRFIVSFSARFIYSVILDNSKHWKLGKTFDKSYESVRFEK